MKKKILAFGLISALFCSTPAMADMNRTTKGALLGAGVGLLTGNGVNGVLKGAAVGAGVGAVTEKGRDGKNARKGAKVGADTLMDIVRATKDISPLVFMAKELGYRLVPVSKDEGEEDSAAL